VIAQSLRYTAFGPVGSADMKDFPPWSIDHVDALAIRRNKPLAGLWKRLEPRPPQIGKQRPYGFLLALHHLLVG
jgi:hypothetical protein